MQSNESASKSEMNRQQNVHVVYNFATVAFGMVTAIRTSFHLSFRLQWFRGYFQMKC